MVEVANVNVSRRKSINLYTVAENLKFRLRIGTPPNAKCRPIAFGNFRRNRAMVAYERDKIANLSDRIGIKSLLAFGYDTVYRGIYRRPIAHVARFL